MVLYLFSSLFLNSDILSLSSISFSDLLLTSTLVFIFVLLSFSLSKLVIILSTVDSREVPLNDAVFLRVTISLRS